LTAMEQRTPPSMRLAWWRRLPFAGMRCRRTEGMSPWRVRLFRFIEARERNASDYYGIPPDRVTEIETSIQL